MRRSFLLAPVWLLVAACHIDAVPTTPLRGPVPAAVLVAPPVNATGIPDRDLREVVAGADTALQQRGYRVLPLAIGFDLLAAHGLGAVHGDAPDLRRLHAAAGVDALLVVEVAVWNPTGRVLEAAEWDLQWRLLATEAEGELWSHHDAGSWRRARRPPIDATRVPDAEPDVLPFGSLAPQTYRTAAELAAALHRAAFARLPRR